MNTFDGNSTGKTARICTRCGFSNVPMAKFCNRCGNDMSAAEYPAKVLNEKKTSKKRGRGLIIALVLLVSAMLGAGSYFLFCDDWKGDDVRKTNETSKTAEAGQKSDSSPAKEVVKTDYGNVKSDGYLLSVEDGTFDAGSNVTVKKLSEEEKAKMTDSENYTIISEPVSVECDTYEGNFFSTEVYLTLSVPDGVMDESEDPGKYVFVYYDDTTGEAHYLVPDELNVAEGTAKLRMDHFSDYFLAKLSPEEQIEYYLNKYCSNAVVSKSEEKIAAEALEPYVNAKLEALQVSEKAFKDLTKSIIKNATLGLLKDQVNPDAKNADELSGDIENLWNNGFDIVTASMEDDKSGVKDGLNNMIAGELIKYSNRMTFGLEGSRSELNAGRADAAGKILSNLNNIADIAGRLTEGDYEGALGTLAKSMESLDSRVEISARALDWVKAEATKELIDWKSNGIEELYYIYRNGRTGFFFKNNDVEPLNDESFLSYLNYGSLNKGNMIRAYYKNDKIEEFCKRTSRQAANYMRDYLDKQAVDSLMNYFHTRYEQESEINKLKEIERKSITDMMDGYGGALRYGNYSEYFGESSYKDYSILTRLEKIEKIRNFITQFVDEDVMDLCSKAEDSFTYGYLVNRWLSHRTNKGMGQALEDFLMELYECDLLNETYRNIIKENLNRKKDESSGEPDYSAVTPASTFVPVSVDVYCGNMPLVQSDMRLEDVVREMAESAQLILNSSGEFSLVLGSAYRDSEFADSQGSGNDSMSVEGLSVTGACAHPAKGERTISGSSDAQSSGMLSYNAHVDMYDSGYADVDTHVVMGDDPDRSSVNYEVWYEADPNTGKMVEYVRMTVNMMGKWSESWDSSVPFWGPIRMEEPDYRFNIEISALYVSAGSVN